MRWGSGAGSNLRHLIEYEHWSREQFEGGWARVTTIELLGA